MNTETESVKKKKKNPTTYAEAVDQALAESETTSITAPEGAPETWGDEGLDSTDILVPKILLMQGLSKMVADETIKARMGEFRDSVEGKLLGDQKKPVDVIVFQSFKTWIVFEEVGGVFEYSATVPMTAENQSWPQEEIVNGVKMRRDYTYNYYCLRPEDIASGAAFPYVVSFRRTSRQAGKKIATFIAKLRAFRKPAAASILSLCSAKQENDKGTFYVFDVSEKRATTQEELNEAFKWHQALKTAKVRVDDSDVKSEKLDDAPVVQAGTVTEDDKY